MFRTALVRGVQGIAQAHPGQAGNGRVAHLERASRVLTWKRARTYALAVGFIYLVAWLHAVVNGQLPLNRAGEPLGGDYIAFYAAGRLVLTGQPASMYDHAAVVQVQNHALGGRVPDFYDAFRNPPFYAVLFVPLATVDLLPSAAVYTLLSGATLALAVYLLLDEVPPLRRRWRGLAAVVFAFPPVYFGLINGENASQSVLLYVLLYRALRSGHQSRAGFWAAMGLFKPQLFLLFPLLFLVTGRWRALTAYVSTAALLAAACIALVGAAGLTAWLRILVDMESGNAARNAWRMVSLKSFFDQLLPNAPVPSTILFAAASLSLVAALLREWTRHPTVTPALWSLTVLVAVLIDPHLVDYDLTVLIPAGILWAQQHVGTRWLIVMLYPILALRASLPIGDGAVQLGVALLMVAVWMVWSDRQRRRGPELLRAVGPPVATRRAQPQ